MYRGRVDNAGFLTFNLPDSGKVEVRLHFAELFWGTPRQPGNGTGKRIFDVVTAKGKTVMNNYDITAASGGNWNVTMVCIRGIKIKDKKLTLGFNAGVNCTSITGIEVLRM